jgi:hypothetical protein
MCLKGGRARTAGLATNQGVIVIVVRTILIAMTRARRCFGAQKTPRAVPWMAPAFPFPMAGHAVPVAMQAQTAATAIAVSTIRTATIQQRRLLAAPRMPLGVTLMAPAT